MSRLERDRKAALAASEAAQRKQKQINAKKEHSNEHDTPAPSAPSIPASSKRPGEHDSPQPPRLDSFGS